MRTSSNEIRRGNMGTHQPSKEQASSRTNIDGKKYVKHYIPGKNNKHLFFCPGMFNDVCDEGHKRD